MTFHNRRLAATRNVKNFWRYRLLMQGAKTINLWNEMPQIELGSGADDWRAVGADMREALSQYAKEHG